ncbi:LytTR family DNA-binding domain-containing protein [Terasakiella pusilla]|uniref:LytTR family DNA-binding domain-containing protein n=1 Tax=Terasakiella pusilla TaxID=64973 RepID=UPI003AA8FA8A
MAFLRMFAQRYIIHKTVALIAIVALAVKQFKSEGENGLLDYLDTVYSVGSLAFFCIVSHAVLSRYIKNPWLLHGATIVIGNFFTVLMDFNLDYFFIKEGIQQFSEHPFLTEYFEDSIYAIAYWGFSSRIDHLAARRYQNMRQEIVEETSVYQHGFLKDLPAHWNGAVDVIEAQENYINLYRGDQKHTLLYRFKDSIAELGSEIGLQVHRSYWVNADAIADFQKKQGRGEITTTHGQQIPVSRTFLKDVERLLQAQ